MKKEDAAWAAGIFEGEGCFSFNQPTSPTAVLKMTDLDVVERWRDLILPGKHITTVTPRESHHKTAYQVKANGFESVQYIVAILWPWLGERRKERARAVLAQTQSTPYRRIRGKYNVRKGNITHG